MRTPVPRCMTCKRALAEYFDGEKTAADLSFGELVVEKAKLQAKIQRLLSHAATLAVTTESIYPIGTPCSGCGIGWREFIRRTKDLRQLTAAETQTVLADVRIDLNRLIARETTLLAAAKAEAAAAADASFKSA